MATGGGERQSKMKGRDDPDVRLSKVLSFVCRHGAAKMGLTVKEGGFIAVEEILGLEDFQKKNTTVEDIERVVANNDKQRFALKDDDGTLYIRANQGHTMDVVDLELEEIHSAAEAPLIIHGTYHKAFGAIRRQGLSKMKRSHIHFAVGLPGDSQVISDGYKFYRSANNVILCPGNEDGFLGHQPYELLKVRIMLGSGEGLKQYYVHLKEHTVRGCVYYYHDL